MVTAFVLVMTNTGKEKEVITSLKETEGVQDAWVVYGDYDIITKLSAASLDELNSIVFEKIRSVKNISMTTTLIAL